MLRETTTYGGLKGGPPFPPREGIRDKRGSLQQGAPGGNSHVLKRMYRDKFNIRRRYVDFACLQRTPFQAPNEIHVSDLLSYLSILPP